ncbi:MAG: hypothetical protein CL878_15635 [Dehalococcoidia bacterium]|nr:hypothetical protein [Dehalococcoidia bacterium]
MKQLLVTGALNRGQLRYLPRLVQLLWEVSPGATIVLGMLHLSAGLLPVAEVHLLRRLVETAQQVVQGSAPLAQGLWWGGALAGLGVIRASLHALEGVMSSRHQEVLRGVIEARCYRQAQALPLEQFDRAEHYDRLQRARTGTDQRLIDTMAFFWGSLSSGVTLLALLVYLGQFHWGLPLLLALGTAPGVWVRTRHQRRRYLLSRSQTPAMRRWGVFNSLLTSRPAAAEVRLFGFGPRLLAQADQLMRRLRGERLAAARDETRATLVADGVDALIYVATIMVSVWLLVTGQASLGLYAALFTAIETFQGNFFALAWTASLVFWDLRYIQDFFEFIDGPRLDLSAGRRLPGPVAQGIVFEDVSFTYIGSEQPALADLNLTIRPGERLALVGENGAGKTTLVKLLMGLYQPTAGRILVDGVDLRDLAPADWYRRFGTVFQDFLRYQTTVRDNITFGWVEGADNEAALAEAVARSGADEVVATLPEGLDTLLGKEFHEGQELSVGQWQKLAIARAYFRPAEILILDEPASALDAKAEAAVYEHFAHLAADRTVVLISHRLGSCRIADRILVLQEGHLVEAGTHADLVAEGGAYAELFQLQAAWYQA